MENPAPHRDLPALGRFSPPPGLSSIVRESEEVLRK